MGQFYEIQRGRHALSTTADSITIDVPAGRKLKVHGVAVTGGDSSGTTSAEMGVYRATGNGSGGSPTSAVLKPLDPNLTAPSGFTAKYGYTTQPTTESDPVIRVPFQPYGGSNSWPPVAGAPAEFWSSSAFQVSVRSVLGTPNATVTLTCELE
jgi:hypothetical protein